MPSTGENVLFEVVNAMRFCYNRLIRLDEKDKKHELPFPRAYGRIASCRMHAMRRRRRRGE
jgi:hypothetical protein